MTSVFRVVFVLWAGSLWSVSWVTWVLFHVQNDRHLAGTLAGPLFTIETYAGLAAAALALLSRHRSRFLWGYVAAALLVLNEWGVRRILVEARLHGSVVGLGFGAWHGVSALFYGIACIALLRLVWQQDFR